VLGSVAEVVPTLDDSALAEVRVVPAWVEAERHAEIEHLRDYHDRYSKEAATPLA
jgi:hypothetical protein